MDHTIGNGNNFSLVRELVTKRVIPIWHIERRARKISTLEVIGVALRSISLKHVSGSVFL